MDRLLAFDLHLTRLERLARDKHATLLQKFINEGCKKFYIIGPRSYFCNP